MHGRFGQHPTSHMIGFDWLYTILTLLGFLILVAIVVGIFLILRNRSANKHHSVNKSLEILQERFARGEISEDEYRSRREVFKEDFDK